MQSCNAATPALTDVALLGNAQMGIYSGSLWVGNTADYQAELQFFTDIDVTFTLSGETYNGIIFGAAVDLDENNAITPASASGVAMIEVSRVLNPGSLSDDETTHFAYRGSYLDRFRDNQIARLEVAFGDVTAPGSVELADSEPGDMS